MTLGAPAWLALLGLLPFVVLLHLRRRRPLDVGSLHVWLRAGDAVRSTSSRQSPLEWTSSLILQLLAVALLAFALADPSLEGANDAAALRHRIHLLDASALMTFRDVAPSRFDAALDALTARLEATRPDVTVSVILVRDRPVVLHARRDTDPNLLDALRTTDATHVAPDWHAAARLVDTLARKDANPGVTVWTAPESAAHAVRAVREAVEDTDVSVATFGTRAPPNAGLTDVVVRPRDEAAPGRWTIHGSVASRGLEGETIPITVYFRPDGTEQALSWAHLDVTVNRSGVTPFELPIDVPGDGTLELRLPEAADAYSGDDRVWRELRDARPIRVLRVGPEDDVIDRALLAMPTVHLYLAASVPPDVDSYDLVVIDGVATGDPPATSVLWLGGEPVDAVGAALSAPDAQPAFPNHPLLGGYDASDLMVERALHLPYLAGSDVILVDEDTGAPLLQARTADIGLQVIVAFDVRESSWPGRLAFPAFLAAVVDAAVPGRDLAAHPDTPCVVGAPCGLPAVAFDPVWTLVDADGEVVARPRGFLSREGDPLAQGTWPSGTWPLQFVPKAPGRYRLTRPGDGDERAVIVDGRPQTAAHPDVDATSASLDEPDPGSNPPEVARWLLLLAAFVVATEAARAARAAEGPLRPAAWFGRRPGGRTIVIATLVLVAVASGVAAWAGVVGPRLTRLATAGRVLIGAEGPDTPDEPTARVIPFDGRRAAEQPDDVGGIDRRVYEVEELDAAFDLIVGALRDPSRSIVHVTADADVELSPDAYLELVARAPATTIEVDVATDDSAADPGPSATPIVRWRFDEPIRAGDTVRISVVADIPGGDAATLVASWEDGPEARQSVSAGRNAVELAVPAPDAPGPRSLSLELIAATTATALAQTATIVEVLPAPRLLILSDHADAADALADRLRLHRIDVDVRPPRRTPSSLEALSEFDVALLLDVPAASLHTVYQDLLEEWVRTRGGGLVVTGGEQSFGAGGYYRTTLEQVSPLSARIPDERPEATLVFVLDRSGSMQAQVGPVTRLDIAKEATTSSFDLLAEESRVGVVAFDTVADTVARISPLADRSTLESAVASISAGGGTSLHPALTHALDLMRGVDSVTKHVIVLTDGLSQPGDFESVLRDLRELDVTTSFIGIGDGADRAQLSNLASLGGGSFHLSLDFRALPGILAQETLSLATDPIEREPILPAWRAPRPPFLTNIEGDPPRLDGHVRTSPQPDASVHLAGSAEETPLLASWRYGLGRVVAFASQAIGPWSASWTADPAMSAFWPQLVRWTAGDVRRAGLSVRMSPMVDRLDISVVALDPDVEPVSGLPLTVHAVDPLSGEPHGTHVLHDDGGGRYSTSLFLGDEPRDLTLEIAHDGDEPPTWYEPVRRGFRVPASPALAAEGERGRPTLGALASIVTSQAGSPSAEEPLRLPWRLEWSSGRTAWAFVMMVAFLASLCLRYGRFGTSRPWRRSKRG